MAAQALVVEDSKTQALRLKLILEREGLVVHVAKSGQEGIDIAISQQPHVVVLDVNLPDMDGFHVCRTLKTHPATAETPVVMLTIQDGASDTLTGLEVGADAYIPKDQYAEANLLQALRDLTILEERS